jgi:iron complex transport system ATP-binding protein
MTALLRAENVVVALDGNVIIDDVSLDIVAGEVLAFVGPNGAGKSTLLAVLSGDIRPQTGSVSYGDRAISGLRHLELARARSVLTQENHVSFSFTVAEVVEMGRSPWARTPESADDDAAIAEALSIMEVTHLAKRQFGSLSGGEKARVSLARVLAQRTPIVFLDEPTAALDLRHQEQVMRTARLIAGSGRAVVVVLHDLSLAAAYSDRVALIDHGRLSSVGTPREVFTQERIAAVYGLAVDVFERDDRIVVVPKRL